MKVQEALNFIVRQGWKITRRTSHGMMLERRGLSMPFAYVAHSKELGATQLRMLTKKFELSPPLIDAHLEKETEMPRPAATVTRMAPMSMRDIGWRVSQAMEHIPMDDATLAQYMGRDIAWVQATKAGRNKLSDEEILALVGIFGRTSDGKINTKWYRSRRMSPTSKNRSRGTMGGPPLIPAPWVVEAELNKQRAAAAATEAPPVAVKAVADAIEKKDMGVIHHERPIPDTTPQSRTSPAATTTPSGNGEAEPEKEQDVKGRIQTAFRNFNKATEEISEMLLVLAEENVSLREKLKDQQELEAAFDLFNEIAARRKSK